MQRPVSLQTPSCQLLASGDRVCVLTWKTATPMQAHTHKYLGKYTICLHTPTPTSAHTHTHPPLLQADSRINLKLSPPSFITQYQPKLLHVPYQRNFPPRDSDRLRRKHKYLLTHRERP